MQARLIGSVAAASALMSAISFASTPNQAIHYASSSRLCFSGELGSDGVSVYSNKIWEREVSCSSGRRTLGVNRRSLRFECGDSDSTATRLFRIEVDETGARLIESGKQDSIIPLIDCLAGPAPHPQIFEFTGSLTRSSPKWGELGLPSDRSSISVREGDRVEIEVFTDGFAPAFSVDEPYSLVESEAGSAPYVGGWIRATHDGPFSVVVTPAALGDYGRYILRVTVSPPPKSDK